MEVHHKVQHRDPQANGHNQMYHHEALLQPLVQVYHLLRILQIGHQTIDTHLVLQLVLEVVLIPQINPVNHNGIHYLLIQMLVQMQVCGQWLDHEHLIEPKGNHHLACHHHKYLIR